MGYYALRVCTASGFRRGSALDRRVSAGTACCSMRCRHMCLAPGGRMPHLGAPACEATSELILLCFAWCALKLLLQAAKFYSHLYSMLPRRVRLGQAQCLLQGQWVGMGPHSVV